MTTTRTKAGQLAIYDAPAPWGPWTVVAYESNWQNANGPRNKEPYPLLYNFVNKWTTTDGLDSWMVFSVHRHGSNKYHDVFNTIKATFNLYENERTLP